MASRIAYWLMPEKPAFSHWREMIDRLARDYRGVGFDPHVTLYAHDQIDGADWRKVIDNRRERTLELEIVELRFSDIFTRSCFIEFRLSEDFLDLRRQIQDASGAAEDYLVQPHMSLFYGNLSKQERHLIQKDVVLPRSIRFTFIRAVLIPKKARNPEDVKAWKYL